jgi:hypothetical protein
MKVKEFKNKTITKNCNGIMLKTAGGFDLLEYQRNEDFIKDSLFDKDEVADFQVNQKNILIIYVYEF